MRPITQTRWDRFGNKLTRELVRQTRWDRSFISVRPKHYEEETESLHCELGGTDRSSRLDRNFRRETESLQSHLGEIEIPIGESEVTRVCGNGYVK